MDHKITDKLASITVTLQTGVPIFMRGEPGTGKSRFVEALGAALNRRVETLIGAMMCPEDVGGMLSPSGDYIMPDWFRRLKSDGAGILFIDELSCAPPSLQGALLRLVAERALHGEKLPNSVYIVAAANPADQAAAGWELAPPMANRFCHLSWEVDAIEWTKGFVKGFNGSANIMTLPEEWTSRLPEARGIVAAYIRNNPVQLQKFPKSTEQQSGPWPSARTWDYAATVMAAHRSVGLDDTDAVIGLIGEGSGLQFLSWREKMNLPSPEMVLEDPKLLPEREDQAFVTLYAVASLAVSAKDHSTWQKAWGVMGVATQRRLVDVAAPAAMILAEAKPKHARPPKEAREFLGLWQESGLLNLGSGAIKAGV
jgi:hypothetical protein